jgi:hypothetical protein
VEGVGKKRQALVQWRGFDRASGNPHQPSWRPVAHVTADLLQPFKRRRVRVSDDEAAPGAGAKRVSAGVRAAVAKRASPRIAGAQPIAGLGEEGGAGRGDERREALRCTVHAWYSVQVSAAPTFAVLRIPTG